MSFFTTHAFSRSDSRRLARWWWTTDGWLLSATFALIVLGVVLQFGTSPAAAARQTHHTWPFHFAVRQCIFAALGGAVVVGASILTPRGVRRVAFVVYILSILAMMALPFVARDHKGAARWVDFSGFSLQPSEFMKPALLVLVAWMFAEERKGEIRGVAVAFGLYALAVGLLLCEPDYGQTILITAAFGAAFWVSGMPIRWILGLGVLAAVVIVVAPVVSPYVAARLDVFSGRSHPAGPTQVQRALEAISAGGAFGRGPGEGVRKTQIPDMHTDFAYSAAAEEYGLWFSLLLISLFALLVLRGFYRAMKIADPYEQVAAAALFSMVGMQAFINVVVNLGLAPTKGMTLPFISYGGSSMLAMSLTMGMALALTRRQQSAYGVADREPEAFG